MRRNICPLTKEGMSQGPGFLRSFLLHTGSPNPLSRSSTIASNLFSLFPGFSGRHPLVPGISPILLFLQNLEIIPKPIDTLWASSYTSILPE
ncbi:hypothetical protein TNIN_235231 [Trichonephila inaurata madagascariensis]|uniref:Uncharacterized protein n=1 Tax=Trichonephila inaurata madagascariensis TaxID=2747483 RepID=A0A8X6WME2_9ARAC|nr:hypothetical protein TNIN_235231 [Trichonephila inaurata madagascariensis]